MVALYKQPEVSLIGKNASRWFSSPFSGPRIKPRYANTLRRKYSVEFEPIPKSLTSLQGTCSSPRSFEWGKSWKRQWSYQSSHDSVDGRSFCGEGCQNIFHLRTTLLHMSHSYTHHALICIIFWSMQLRIMRCCKWNPPACGSRRWIWSNSKASPQSKLRHDFLCTEYWFVVYRTDNLPFFWQVETAR